MIGCPACGGRGEVPIPYWQDKYPGSVNDHAAAMAGRISHYEPCETCNGTGEVDDGKVSG